MRVSPFSASVRIARPIWAVSPGSAARVSTSASAGARSVSSSRRADALATLARACSMRMRASSASAPPSRFPCAWACAAASTARALASLRTASSTRACATNPRSSRSRARTSSSPANRRLACACASCCSLTGRCTRTSCRCRPSASRSAAPTASSAAAASSLRNCTSTAPADTDSPSRTAIRSMRAASWLDTSIRAGVDTRPVATTDWTIGARCTVTMSTSRPRPNMNSAPAASTTSISARVSQRLRRIAQSPLGDDPSAMSPNIVAPRHNSGTRRLLRPIRRVFMSRDSGEMELETATIAGLRRGRPREAVRPVRPGARASARTDACARGAGAPSSWPR